MVLKSLRVNRLLFDAWETPLMGHSGTAATGSGRQPGMVAHWRLILYKLCAAAMEMPLRAAKRQRNITEICIFPKLY